MSKSHHSATEVRTHTTQKRYAERRHWLDSIKVASGCKDCKIWGPPELLTFDHIIGDKKFNIGQSWNQGKKALEEEIAKCEIVCSNCHAVRTKKRAKEERTGIPPFVPFPKIPRLSRDCIITEKLDGTNAAVWVDGDGDVWAASKGRWLDTTSAGDNYGFAKWVEKHEKDFRDIGEGIYSGEWWGKGIQRNYGLLDRRFSLFNTSRWSEPSSRPSCCDVVPVMYQGIFSTEVAEETIEFLRRVGSSAAPGFMFPEGIIVYHIAANKYFKKTISKDEEHKGKN